MNPKLKQFSTYGIYLYIIALFSGALCAQEIELSVTTDPVLNTAQRDSLQIPKTFANYTSMKTALDSLTLRLQKFGFLESQRTQLEQTSDSTYAAHYSLGNRWTAIELSYSELQFDPKDFLELGYKAKDSILHIPLVQLESFLEGLSRIKATEGTPFASIQLSGIEQLDNHLLAASLQLNPREERRIDGWVIKGYDKFPKSFLRYYAGVKKGRVFNREKLVAQNEVLDQLGFVRSIKAPEALFKKDSTLVYFYFEKTNNNLFDGILGFATNEETQKLEFNGYLNLELNNNLNYGEQLKIDYKADGREQQNFQANLKLPYLFKTPLGVRLGLKIFKRDSTFSITEQQARLYYQTSPQTQIYAGYKGNESNNLLDSPLSNETVLDFEARYFLTGGDFRIPQSNAFFPIKTYIGIEAEVGKRTTNTSEENQFRLEANGHHIFNLNTENSIYIGTTTAYLQSDTYLENDLFRFGGITTLRGFNENSIDASLFTVINSEYRYQFSNALYVNSLLDFSYFENETLNLQEELYSFGFGLGLNTQSGILRLNIANGLSQNQDLDLAQTKVHLLFSTRF